MDLLITDFKWIKGITQIVLLAQNENAVCNVLAIYYKMHFNFYEVKNQSVQSPLSFLKSVINFSHTYRFLS